MGILSKIRRNRAIKKIATRLPPFLVSGYGYSDTYTPGQVETALEKTGCNGDYIDHAYAMFCSQSNFPESSTGNYEAVHQEVADICFSGNSNFSFSDISSFSVVSAGGASQFDGSGFGGGDGGGNN